MASPSLSNVTFPVFRSNLNDIIQALDTVNAGTTAPTDYDAYTLWLDTNSPVTLKIRNAGNTAWVSVLTMTGEDVSGAGWFVDEDAMSSDSATKVPSQQSVKAYVDNSIRTDEEIEDLAAAMLVNGTHDGISFIYDDTNGEIDATVDVAGGGVWIVVQDEKSAGTNGGGFTSGAWRTRDLNTEVADPNGNCLVSSNQFTLTAGEYGLLIARAPAFNNVDNHRAALYSVTGSTYLAYGQTATSGSNVTSVSTVVYHIGTLGVDTTFEIRHRSENSNGTDGFGRGTSIGGINEVYTQVQIQDLN